MSGEGRRAELGYYQVGGDYGWNQEKFRDPIMNGGGCAAVTACDSCIYFRRYFGMDEICPLDPSDVTPEGYQNFAAVMKPYLHPRWRGIDTLDVYMDGLGRYFSDKGEKRISMRGFAGERTFDEAAAAIKAQIDERLPIPCLMLKHKDKKFQDFTWHWFIINGYEENPAAGSVLVKIASYGEWIWLDLKELWDTGYAQKGGLILYEIKK